MITDNQWREFLFHLALAVRMEKRFQDSVVRKTFEQRMGKELKRPLWIAGLFEMTERNGGVM